MTYQEFHTRLGEVLEHYSELKSQTAEVWEPHSWGSPNITEVKVEIDEEQKPNLFITVEEK